MKNTFPCLLLAGTLLFSTSLFARKGVDKQLPWSVRMTQSEMIRCPESWQLDFQPGLKWDYCHGLELQAMLDVYDAYGDRKIYDYVLAYADTVIHNDGSVETYKLQEYNIDRLNSGKFLYRIYDQSCDPKYKKAIDLLRSQLDTHPRNDDGGFWHKKIYPHQMWLDGIYMGCPFYAEYAYRYNRPQDYRDIVNQILTIARHTYDPQNGLYRHACDVSRKERWANPVTGQSAHSWGRAMGWYAMALVDVLDFLPKEEAGRDSVLAILENIAVQVKRLQDPQTGLWYQVLDKSGAKGNYLESSCSTMFVYALFKAVRKGYIEPSYLDVALKGYQGILNHFIEVDEDGLVTITKACAVAGLGGKNYRSGDYNYYINETIRSNDPKAVGPFIMASLEYERLVVVAADGSGKYRTIQEAVEGVRAFMDYTVTVYIKNGIYKEKVVIPSWIKNVQLLGESPEGTIITYDDHANINKMGTFRTYTLKVEGSDVTFRNLTVENNAPRLGQAVALHTEGDRLRFIGCRFLGNQDTVYTGAERTRLYFSGCYIEGTTDFIFGPSTALFDSCVIHSKSNSYVTAASTPREVELGYVFRNCKLTAAPGVDKVYLGRPWRPYASTVFLNCELGGHICPAGWDNWRDVRNERTARYGEYRCSGTGAGTDGRVKWAKQLSQEVDFKDAFSWL